MTLLGLRRKFSRFLRDLNMDSQTDLPDRSPRERIWAAATGYQVGSLDLFCLLGGEESTSIGSS